jgi:hypothetical protein
MGTKWFTGGIVAAPRGRIQFDFIHNGVRYRPSIKRPPSEANGKISITKAVVNGQPKNRTKTNQDREVNLCPRALQVLHAQLSLRAQMAADGMINHNHVFFTAGWRAVCQHVSAVSPLD